MIYVAAVQGMIQSRPAAHQQAVDGLPTEKEISRRNSGTVAVRGNERLQAVVQG